MFTKPEPPKWRDLSRSRQNGGISKKPNLLKWRELEPKMPKFRDLKPKLPKWRYLEPKPPKWMDFKPKLPKMEVIGAGAAKLEGFGAEAACLDAANLSNPDPVIYTVDTDLTKKICNPQTSPI